MTGEKRTSAELASAVKRRAGHDVEPAAPTQSAVPLIAPLTRSARRASAAPAPSGLGSALRPFRRAGCSTFALSPAVHATTPATRAPPTVAAITVGGHEVLDPGAEPRLLRLSGRFFCCCHHSLLAIADASGTSVPTLLLAACFGLLSDSSRTNLSLALGCSATFGLARSETLGLALLKPPRAMRTAASRASASLLAASKLRRATSAKSIAPVASPLPAKGATPAEPAAAGLRGAIARRYSGEGPKQASGNSSASAVQLSRLA